jgi:hypothetical protein
MDGVIPLLWLAILIVLAVAVLAIFSINSGNKNDSQTASRKSVKHSNQGWKNWIPFIGMALVIAFWTISGALFFIVIVWIIGLNPKTEFSSIITDEHKSIGRSIYQWLLVSPVLSIPFSIFLSILLESNIYGHVLATCIPLILHFHLLFNIRKSLYIYRHTQQALALLVLRAAVAAWALYDFNIALFLLGNGSIWLFGGIWGFSQIKRGKCWLMEQRGEKITLPETAKVDSPQMDKELEDMLKSLNAKDALAAKTKALNAFRAGTPATKKRALEVLSKLGEVEEF